MGPYKRAAGITDDIALTPQAPNLGGVLRAIAARFPAAGEKLQPAPGKIEPAVLVIWWMSKNPYAAVFENRIAAEAAANVRNAILVTFKGNGTDVEAVVDWFRRDEEGRPMPAEWRQLMGQVRAPWFSKAHSEASEIGPPSTAASDPVEA